MRDADIRTMEPNLPRARWMACVGERVALLGLDDEPPPASEVIDAAGAPVLPGFYDAHNHMAWFGLTLAEVDVSAGTTPTLQALYDVVATRAAAMAPDAWVVCSGYDQYSLGSHPGREQLDRAAGGRPVWVKHRSGHMCVVNSPILEQLGLSDTARDIPGGHVVTDANGRPTGLLQEEAQDMVNDLILPYRQHDLASAIARASEVYASEGLTSVTEAGVAGGWIGKSPIEVGAYQLAREAQTLRTRVQLMVTSPVLHNLAGHADDDANLGIDLGLRTGFGDSWLSIGPVKVFADGSLIGQTAAVCEGYGENPDDLGLLLDNRDALVELIVRAHRSDWTVAAHAIGDRAIDLVLDAFAAAQRARNRASVRHRIEHFGLSRLDQVRRAADLGIVPVPQGRFATELGDGILDAVGARHHPLIYRQRSLLDAGLVLPGSSDRPVVTGSPLLGVHDMVNRRTARGSDFNGGESVTVGEALRAYTLGSAYAAGLDHERGSLTPGRLADFVLLDRDPFAIEPDELATIDVTRTVVGGQTVFRRN